MRRNENIFNALTDRAMQENQVAHMRAVVQKELLHYDILYCLEQAGLLGGLVFQGALRSGCVTARTATARIWILLAARTCHRRSLQR